jgi:hypothetical protein
MLKLVSRFVLEVLPYVLSALIAAVVVPSFLHWQLYGREAAGTPTPAGGGISLVELVRHDRAVFGALPALPGRNDSDKHFN